MKPREKDTFSDIYNEVKDSVKKFKEKSETGNSIGEHKEFYRGQYQAYSRVEILIEGFLHWHSITLK